MPAGWENICLKSATNWLEENLWMLFYYVSYFAQRAITCSKLTIETLEQGVKYVQS